MPAFICVTCGVQYPDSPAPPDRCPICEDERQYVGWDGQRWTTLAELRESHRNDLQPEGPGLTGIVTQPSFAIGQRALHVAARGARVLWDCVTLIDDATVAALRRLGGVDAIAVSHPHYYSAIVEWSHALGRVPVYLHADDRRWMPRSDPVVVFWEGETRRIAEGLTLIRCGGHFDGATVLHWEDGAAGAGVLLVGDVLQVGQDRNSVSFMYSYPNYIPLGPRAVHRIVAALEPYPFAPIYGAFRGRNVAGDGERIVRASAERYLRAIRDGA